MRSVIVKMLFQQQLQQQESLCNRKPLVLSLIFNQNVCHLVVDLLRGAVNNLTNAVELFETKLEDVDKTKYVFSILFSFDIFLLYYYCNLYILNSYITDKTS